MYIYIYMNMYVRIRNDGGVFSFARRASQLSYYTPRLVSVRIFFHLRFISLFSFSLSRRIFFFSLSPSLCSNSALNLYYYFT